VTVWWSHPRCRRGLASALVWCVLAAVGGCEQVPEGDLINGGGAGGDEGAPPPASSLCDPVQQSCPNGFKCSAFVESEGDVRYKCVDELAWNSVYGPCDVVGDTTNDGCPKGSACLPASLLSSEGLCLPLCQQGEGCTATARCLSTVGVGVSYCAPTCDALSPECPIPTMRCMESSIGFACRFESSVNLHKAGQGCGPSTEKLCDEGLVCLNAGLLLDCVDASCCAPLCDLEGPESDCGTATECVPLDAPGYPAGIGACHIPF
jgi:hypothetical protein